MTKCLSWVKKYVIRPLQHAPDYPFEPQNWLLYGGIVCPFTTCLQSMTLSYEIVTGPSSMQVGEYQGAYKVSAVRDTKPLHVSIHTPAIVLGLIFLQVYVFTDYPRPARQVWSSASP